MVSWVGENESLNANSSHTRRRIRRFGHGNPKQQKENADGRLSKRMTVTRFSKGSPASFEFEKSDEKLFVNFTYVYRAGEFLPGFSQVNPGFRGMQNLKNDDFSSPTFMTFLWRSRQLFNFSYPEFLTYLKLVSLKQIVCFDVNFKMFRNSFCRIFIIS